MKARKTASCLVALAAAGSLWSVAASAATLSWSTTAPVVDGEDIANYVGVTADADNINGGNNAQTYVASGSEQQGQTFTTGSNASGYVLSAITLQHVQYTSDTTSYDLGPGWPDPFTLRLGSISGGTFTASVTETAAMNSYFSNGTFTDTGSGVYCTLTLDTPITLAPNTTYAFTLDSSNPWFELNGDGTTDANYAGGTAFTATEQSNPAASTTYTGDRVFHLDIEVQPPLTLKSTSPSGYGTTNTPTLEVVIADGASDLDTNSVTLYLDDAPSPIDYINVDTPDIGQTTIGGTWTNALDPGTIHTGMVVYAGINPSAGPLTNSWNFTVELAQDGSHVVWYSTTESQHWQRIWDPTLVAESPSVSPDVTIVPSTTYQTIDGFGGSFNELGGIALSKATSGDQTAVLEALFSDSGLDFNMARIPIGSSDFATNIYGSASTADDDDYSFAETPGDYELNDFTIERDRRHMLPYIEAAMAVRPDLECWGSPWSPPEWMKDNNYYAGGSLIWTPAILQTYANYFVKWIEAYRGEGVNVFAVLAQNEPNQWQVFPSCVWTGDQLAEFIGDYLGPTLAASNSNVEVWFGINGDPGTYNGDDFTDRIYTVMSDPVANAYVDAIGFQYDSQNQISLAHSAYPDKKLIQTESFCFNGDNTWFDATTRNDGMQGLSRNLQRNFENGANAYFAWNMILDETGLGPWNWRQNAPITVNSSTGKVTYNHEFYIYKHYSHFVKPGAKRILTVGGWDEKIAFKNPDGSVVLVMGNSTAEDQALTFAMEEWTGDNTISVTLPANSFNTFIFPAEAFTKKQVPSNPPATLAHRYSFGETSGSTVSDSIGSAHGSLPNGGTWGDGELSLSSSSSQYVDLPGHLLDGYTNVTIELWASFPEQLPTYCHLFDFGNTNGTDGVNYLTCLPESATIAITDSNWSGEQSASGIKTFSYQNNLHVTAVFNTTDGRLELYLNGVLEAVSSDITLPMSSVENVYSYIGKSLYYYDPYFNFTLDEFRIYNGAMSPFEVAASQILGPDQVLQTDSTPLSMDASANNILLNWPLAYAHSMILQSSTNLVEGSWADEFTVDPELVGDSWQLDLPTPDATNIFFRLRQNP